MFLDCHYPSYFMPYVFLIDTSESMNAEVGNIFSRIEFLNGLMSIVSQEFQSDEWMSKCADVAVITFGDKEPCLVQDWVSGKNFIAPTLSAFGDKPLGESLIQALIKAMDLCKKRACYYKLVEVNYFQPYIFIVSDGEFIDDINVWKNIVCLTNLIKESKKAKIFVVGIDGGLFKQLSNLSNLDFVLEASSFSILEFFRHPEMYDYYDNDEGYIV